MFIDFDEDNKAIGFTDTLRGGVEFWVDSDEFFKKIEELEER